jgi:hypothetical protein
MKAQVHSIESEQQAAEVLKYFHDFHDGFIKRIELVSQDSFRQEGPEHPGPSHVCTGEFNLSMDIAHFNYGPINQPFNRLVCIEFRDVRDFSLDLRDHSLYHWDISAIHINSVTRPLNILGATEAAFELLLTRSFYVEDTGWEQRKQTLFSFKSAIAKEKLST